MRPTGDLDEAMRASEKATELSNKFITFSSDGQPIKKLHPIKELIHSAVDLTLSGSRVKPLYLYFLPDDLWPVFIDSDQISQAFFNIIENAKESMTTGGTLQIKGKNIVVDQDQSDSNLPLSPDDYVMVSFQDGGHGIPEEYLSRIFDPYFTTNAKGTKKGKGIGLSTTYSIIKNHKGYIFVDSKRGTGTSVYIYIPASSGQSSSTQSNALSSETDKKTKTVLVMDDEAMIRDMSQSLLETMGHKVVLATDGENALALYKKAHAEGRPFNLLILDLTIPGGLGGE